MFLEIMNTMRSRMAVTPIGFLKPWTYVSTWIDHFLLGNVKISWISFNVIREMASHNRRVQYKENIVWMIIVLHCLSRVHNKEGSEPLDCQQWTDLSAVHIKFTCFKMGDGIASMLMYHLWCTL